MVKIIYLDNGATMPVYKEVAEAMKNAMIENYGNPSSNHLVGEGALNSINKARENLAREIGAKASEIIFTSGASESNNLALFGLVNSFSPKKKIIISAIEHASVHEPCEKLKSLGYDVVEIPVDKSGLIDIKELEKQIDEKTLVVSIIHGHNELGVLQELDKIGEICKKKGVFLHSDAAQSFGKEKIDVNKMNISLLSASAHKIGGPKGIGFLYIREGIFLEPIIYGGGQEKGIRSGTENVAGIIGFVKALEIAKKTDKKIIRETRDYFMEKLKKIGGKINGSREKRLFNNVNVCFEGLNSEMLAGYLSGKGIMASTRSACSSKEEKENRVLRAIGLNREEIEGSMRFVLSENITKKDVDVVIKEIGAGIKKFRI